MNAFVLMYMYICINLSSMLQIFYILLNALQMNVLLLPMEWTYFYICVLEI
jgi:hypothetical protein